MATIGVWGPRGGEKEREEAGIIMQLTKEQRKVREREREREHPLVTNDRTTALYSAPDVNRGRKFTCGRKNVWT